MFDLKNMGLKDVNGVPVLDVQDLSNYVKERKIKLGIISVPAIEAGAVLDIMKAAGIKGILNFASVELKSTPECIINNMSIAMEIDGLFFHVQSMERKNNEA